MSILVTRPEITPTSSIEPACEPPGSCCCTPGPKTISSWTVGVQLVCLFPTRGRKLGCRQEIAARHVHHQGPSERCRGRKPPVSSGHRTRGVDRFGKGMRSSAKIREAVRKFAKKREESLLEERCTISTTDFVTYMLILRSKGAHSITLEDIVDNVMGIIIGAHGTTSALITFMMRHLANEPDVLAKITEGVC
ncbi:hypothetical protein BDA96_05G209300 [Sorghum bicolor]|uniref:Uncharacterized protein n=1 Tax=Sorghum bicolor TaxID=4558 RepID=A0A921R1R7_SORBI|nr:hypothetical protein BDA96_05G209300 [Sorghum bicolor]